MMTNAKIGIAVVGGYFLGRTKKAKMAIGLGMFMAGRKLSLDPKELKGLLTNNPLLAGLSDQVRKELVDATKSAATSALTNRAEGLADSLHKRTIGLNNPGGEDDEDDGRGERDEQDDARGSDDERDDGGTGESKSADTRQKAPAKKAAAGGRSRSGGTGGSTAKRAGGAAKSGGGTGKKAASGAKKSTSGAAKSTTGGARKAATGTVRKAGERGGGNG